MKPSIARRTATPMVTASLAVSAGTTMALEWLEGSGEDDRSIIDACKHMQQIVLRYFRN